MVTQGFGLFDRFMTDFFLIGLSWDGFVWLFFFRDTLELMHIAQSLILSLLNFIYLFGLMKCDYDGIIRYKKVNDD